MNVFVTCDPATSTRKKTDYSACVVQGQDDTGTRYLLDGFRARLGPEDLPAALADIIQKWQVISAKAGGSFRFGIESFAFSQYIAPALRDEMRRRGMSCHVEELKHNMRAKADRIAVLAGPYSMGSVLWPRRLEKPVPGEPGATYDLVECLKDEFLRFSPKRAGLHDDMLDACAYGEVFMAPVLVRAEVAAEANKPPDPSVYTRNGPLPEEAGEREQHAGRYIPPDPSAYYRGDAEAGNRIVSQSGRVRWRRDRRGYADIRPFGRR